MTDSLHGCGTCTDIGAREAPELEVFDVLPRVLPAGWTIEAVRLPSALHGQPGPKAVRYTVRAGRGLPLVVFVTLDDMPDGAGIWLHSSTSRSNRLASWEDLKLVHQVVHNDRPVVQIMPPRSSWLSIAECLHLFERLDAPTVPEQLWRKP